MPDHAARPEALQDDAHLLRHLLQPGKVSGPRAERPLRITERRRRGWKRGNFLVIKI